MVVSPSYQYPPPTNLLQSLTSMQRAGRRISLCCLCTRSKKQDVRASNFRDAVKQHQFLDQIAQTSETFFK
jgi:hypothetical protein